MKRLNAYTFAIAAAFLLALTVLAYAAGAITMSTDLSQVQLDAMDWKIARLNSPPSPQPAPASPWTRQSIWDRNCLANVKDWISESKIASAQSFCIQWDNPGGALSACPNPSPASGPLATGCAYTAAQKNAICTRFSRPDGCDLCR